MKIKPERIAGIVALSYLALIPIGGFLAWQKIRSLDRDVAEIWDHVSMPAEQNPVIDGLKLKKIFGLR